MTAPSLSYTPGHPWYYVLGGEPLALEEIKQRAIASGYQGYCFDRIEKADRLAEPKRSQVLRQMRAGFMEQLEKNTSQYQECMATLKVYHENTRAHDQPACADVHTSISLKYNHLYNDYAILHQLEERVSCQRDLFERF